MDNLRIKFVGFIANETNYIVDLDNREVIFKRFGCTSFRKLTSKVTVLCNELIKSQVVTFRLYDEPYVAEVEVFPNCIDHCGVTLTSLVTHQKEILPIELCNYDYFDMVNMLDSKGNLKTKLDYSVVLNVPVAELRRMYTHGEAVEFIYNILQSIKCNKDTKEVVKKILLSVRSKMGGVRPNIQCPIVDIPNLPTEDGCCCEKPETLPDFYPTEPDLNGADSVLDNMQVQEDLNGADSVLDNMQVNDDGTNAN